MNGEELARFEHLSRRTFEVVGEERNQAEAELRCFYEDASYVGHNRYVLEHSQSPHALTVATNSLLNLVTKEAAAFGGDDRHDLRLFVLNCILHRGEQMEHFVVVLLVQLVTRLTKIGWFEHESFRSVTADVRTLIDTSFFHCRIAMMLLAQLIVEMNSRLSIHTPMQQRKVITSFRDETLIEIFDCALEMVRSLVSGAYHAEAPETQEAMLVASFNVLCEVMSFDYIGALPDDKRSKTATIQLPSTWRDRIEDVSQLHMFFQLYATTQTAPATVMRLLTQYVSIRRSLFTGEATRLPFVNAIVGFMTTVMQTKQALDRPDCFHEFSRLLFHFKMNYPLAEIRKSDMYSQWIDTLANFTVLSFQSWTHSPNSYYYQLLMWCHLCSSARRGHIEQSTLLGNYAPQIVEAFVRSRLDSVPVIVSSGGAFDDPLEDAAKIREMMDNFAHLGRFQYEATCELIVGLFDPLAAEYQQTIHMAFSSGGAADVVQHLAVLEGQLAWLVYVIAGVVGGRSSSRKKENADIIDGELSVRAFQLMGVSNEVLQERGGANANELLDMAVVTFLRKFRKAHIGDQGQSRSRAYDQLAAVLNMRDAVAVLDVMIGKICVNLVSWSTEQQSIIEQTLDLFMELAKAPYTSLRLLTKLDSVTYLLGNHASQTFSFLQVTSSEEAMRHRQKFYRILGTMMFLDINNNKFEHFVRPFDQACQEIGEALLANNSATLSDPAFVMAIRGMMYDLMGIVQAAKKAVQYRTVFEWVFGNYHDLFHSILEYYVDHPIITTAFLEFWGELVENRAARISFPAASPNGILLFKATARIVATFADASIRSLEAALPTGGFADPYDEWLHGAKCTFDVVTHSLKGDYCCFGVFELYNDDALHETLRASIALLLAVPADELMTYPPLMRSFFSLLEVIFQSHMDVLIMLPQQDYAALLHAIHAGLQSFHRRVFTQSCCALDQLTTFHFKALMAQDERAVAVAAHAEVGSVLLPEVLATLFNVYLFQDSGKLPQWAVSRPFLNLILLYPDHYQMLRDNVIAAQETPERRAVLEAGFDKLLEGVDLHSLSSPNRERFSNSLAFCRNTLRKLNSMPRE